MWQRLVAFLTRCPPLLLFQYTIYVFAIGLFALGVHVKNTEQIRHFHADKSWSDLFGDLSLSKICLSPGNAINASCDVIPQGKISVSAAVGGVALHTTATTATRASRSLLANGGGDVIVDPHAGALAVMASPHTASTSSRAVDEARTHIFLSMPLKMTMTPSDACLWRSQAVGNSSSIHITGSLCGSQLRIKGDNKTWVAVSVTLAVDQVKKCCGQLPKSDDCKLNAASSCVGLWIPANRVPAVKRPAGCSPFSLPTNGLSTEPRVEKNHLSSKARCNSSSFLFTRQPKRHVYFLFDLYLSKSDKDAIADKLSTLSICTFVIAAAMTSILLYKTNTQKRIVAVDTL